jgi:hypothetical protein
MTELTARIAAYLSGGGLFNSELADPDAMRDLLIDCRERIEELEKALEPFATLYNDVSLNELDVDRRYTFGSVPIEHLRTAARTLKGEG